MKNTQAFNQFIANLSVLNVKLHNLHWNVVGINFVAVHTFTESLYEGFFETYDAVAEHLKINGQMPLARMSDYLEVATIKELEPKAFTTSEVLTILLEDLSALRNEASQLRNLSDEAGDFIAVSLLEDFIGSLDKNLWFLKSMNA